MHRVADATARIGQTRDDDYASFPPLVQLQLLQLAQLLMS
jgi:hypothetical protein